MWAFCCINPRPRANIIRIISKMQSRFSEKRIQERNMKMTSLFKLYSIFFDNSSSTQAPIFNLCCGYVESRSDKTPPKTVSVSWESVASTCRVWNSIFHAENSSRRTCARNEWQLGFVRSSPKFWYCVWLNELSTSYRDTDYVRVLFVFFFFCFLLF